MAQVETRLFRYFTALADERHFGHAALRLKISAPTLTHQIKKLESALGTKLVERRGTRNIELTDAGRHFLEHARQILRQIDEAQAVARRAARGEVGLIRTAFQYVVACAGVLQEPIMEFQRANPGIEITMNHLITMDQIKAILHNDLDVGFARPPTRYPAGLQGFVVFRQPAVLAMPANHRLANRKKIAPSELADEEFVNPPVETDLVFQRQEDSVSDVGQFTPQIKKRASDIFTVLTYVSAGYGIAVVSQSLTRIALPNVVYREINADPRPETQVAVMYRRNETSRAVRMFVDFMRRRSVANSE
jgi:DNA-binding transcriptional LysR family regulator